MFVRALMRTKVSRKPEETTDLLEDVFPGDQQNYDDRRSHQ